MIPFARLVTGIVLIFLCITCYFILSVRMLSVIIMGLGLFSTFIEWPSIYPCSKPGFFIVTLCYPLAPFAALIAINEQFHALVAPLFITVFSCDTGAYCIGTFLGKTPLAPSISPQKTVEGMIGGIITAVISGFVYKSMAATHWTLFYTLVFSLVSCCGAITGDLFESWLKRKANLKESGFLLPGHGGLLDRFDSVLGAACLVYICAILSIL